MKADKILSIGISILIGAFGYLWNKNTELEHRLTSLEVGHEEVEVNLKQHTQDPKLHHNIKEDLSAIEKQVVVLIDRLSEIGDDLDEHESHPKLHENIVTTVKVLEERVKQLEKQ